MKRVLAAAFITTAFITTAMAGIGATTAVADPTTQPTGSADLPNVIVGSADGTVQELVYLFQNGHLIPACAGDGFQAPCS